jgi:hypothetical protein
MLARIDIVTITCPAQASRALLARPKAVHARNQPRSVHASTGNERLHMHMHAEIYS